MRIFNYIFKRFRKKSPVDLVNPAKYSKDEFFKTKELYEEFKESYSTVFSAYNLDRDHVDPTDEIAFEEWQENKLHNLNNAFKLEYDFYINHNIYFFGCPIKIYKTHYYKRMYEYLENSGNENEESFIENEFRKGTLEFDFNFLQDDLQTSIEDSLKHRYVFLINQLKQLGLQLLSDIDGEGFKITKIHTESSIDLVDEDTLEDDMEITNAKERVIYLNETGVLKYLKEFDSTTQTSTNKLAKLLSYIIGFKFETIQSYINPIINEKETLRQANNPYKNEKNVSKVRSILTNKIGIELKDEYTKHF